jgi:hypothetical protein
MMRLELSTASKADRRDRGLAMLVGKARGGKVMNVKLRCFTRLRFHSTFFRSLVIAVFRCGSLGFPTGGIRLSPTEAGAGIDLLLSLKTIDEVLEFERHEEAYKRALEEV